MTTKASHGDSGCDCQATMLCQRNRVGSSTVWPRLETGNSSVAPWTTPSTIAWNVEIRWAAANESKAADYEAGVWTRPRLAT